uniref:D-aspartate oxidase-like n=1 Tax=Ciona intestinalis TaxID=7719 RepID=UPI0000524B27|nr:D-aspartate oxidase-like [Ciona intestinalis]|eukprot:XP_002123458.1 D-aspartate oxidase-like [Ciona intestinalis]
MDVPIKIDVLGAGINGLASAYCLANEFPKSHITITAERFTGTTSDHGFGIIMNRTYDKIYDNSDVTGYIQKTVEHLKTVDHKTSWDFGLRTREMLWIYNAQSPEDAEERVRFFAQTCLSVRKATDEELAKLNNDKKNILKLQPVFDLPLNPGSVCYFMAKVFVLDTSFYLPWLRSRLLSLKDMTTGQPRVNFVEKKVSRLSEFDEADIIVNCSGVGAREVANDKAVTPVRGQYVRVRAPENLVLHTYLQFSDHSFVCPRVNDTCLGSVYQPGRTDTAINAEDTESLLRRCEVFVPDVREAEVVAVDVGIRPARVGGPRVEVDPQLSPNDRTIVIHNYGHGSKGVAQHWGCALKVTALAKENLRNLQSKM